jgi:putative transposase
MPQSLSKVIVHLIFSTKNREPNIPEPIRSRLHAYLVGILDNLKSPSLQTGSGFRSTDCGDGNRPRR